MYIAYRDPYSLHSPWTRKTFGKDDNDEDDCEEEEEEEEGKVKGKNRGCELLDLSLILTRAACLLETEGYLADSNSFFSLVCIHTQNCTQSVGEF